LLAIQDVAKASGVSSRTLRHYDEIGLLKPAQVADSGIRYYGRDELLSLQRILLMRELDLGLSTIKAVLEQQTEVEALRGHRRELENARKRFARLAKTIDQTIADIEGERNMSAAELFEGFD